VNSKIPQSVLVVIYTRALDVLILKRADHPDFWQSVTGSLDSADEPLLTTAAREVLEETGIDAREHQLADWRHVIEYAIYPRYLHRYAPGVVRNTEHWFGLTLEDRVPVELSPREHTEYAWLNYVEAAKQCFSPSNAEAILQIPRRLQNAAP
jgi:dATP pyrophosphohydrolase